MTEDNRSHAGHKCVVFTWTERYTFYRWHDDLEYLGIVEGPVLDTDAYPTMPASWDFVWVGYVSHRACLRKVLYSLDSVRLMIHETWFRMQILLGL